MMMRGCLIVGFVAVALAGAACSSRSEPAPEQQTQEGELITDIASMTQQADGTFLVWCKNGAVERNVTAEAIAAQRVCGPPGPMCMNVSSSAYCQFEGAHYMGDGKCCSDKPLSCMNVSSSAYCQFGGGHYMGDGRCCSEKALTCMNVSSSAYCQFDGGHYMGDGQCCSEKPLSCTTVSSSASCQFQGAHYMGDGQCCREQPHP